MKLLPTALPGVVIIEPAVFGDDRGWFYESFNEARFNAALDDIGLPPAPRFVQDNHSNSKAGVLRGLHYQLPPHAQGKHRTASGDHQGEEERRQLQAAPGHARGERSCTAVGARTRRTASTST